MHNLNPFLRCLVQSHREWVGGGGGVWNWKLQSLEKRERKGKQNQKQAEGHSLIPIQGHRCCSSVSRIHIRFNFERWGGGGNLDLTFENRIAANFHSVRFSLHAKLFQQQIPKNLLSFIHSLRPRTSALHGYPRVYVVTSNWFHSE